MLKEKVTGCEFSRFIRLAFNIFDGKNAKLFAPAIEDNDNLIVSSINLYEVYKKVMTQRSEYDAKDGRVNDAGEDY